jgi:hypothetical protein
MRNFGERRLGEGRTVVLPRTRVNKAIWDGPIQVDVLSKITHLWDLPLLLREYDAPVAHSPRRWHVHDYEEISHY